MNLIPIEYQLHAKYQPSNFKTKIMTPVETLSRGIRISFTLKVGAVLTLQSDSEPITFFLT